MVQTAQNRSAVKSPDFALLMQRLEKRVLQEPDPERVEELLNKPSVWRRLEPEQALRWATFAEIAGLPDVSLQVLADVSEHYPNFEPAWRKRVELLETLGRNAQNVCPKTFSPSKEKELSFSLQKTSRSRNNPSLHNETKVDAGMAATDGPSWDQEIEAPFFTMRRQEKQLQEFLDVFRGREDCFARQWSDRKTGGQGYVPVRRAMEPQDLIDHLKGHKTYGIYLLQQDSRVRTAVLDADVGKKLRTAQLSAADRDLLNREKRYLLSRLPEISREQGLPCLSEFSGGKGFHFWFIFSQPTGAMVARQALQAIAKRIGPDLSCFNLEVFPKQDRLAGKGLGNLVKLPLGIHRATGKRSFFIHMKDRSPWAQLGALERIERIDPATIKQAREHVNSPEPAVHPRYQQWARQYPELAVLGDRCIALGQIFSDCRQARSLSVREEKVLLGTLGFLPRSRTLLHHLYGSLPDYNAHLVDYRLSRLRGTPLGCKRIHSLLNLTGDRCLFQNPEPYPHPLLHWPQWHETQGSAKSERVTNLQDALEQLKHAMGVVECYLKQ